MVSKQQSVANPTVNMKQKLCSDYTVSYAIIPPSEGGTDWQIINYNFYWRALSLTRVSNSHANANDGLHVRAQKKCGSPQAATILLDKR